MRRRGTRSRRWCVPPAVLRGPDETLEGAAILGEVPGQLGLLLWRTARDVRLWAEASPDTREVLFAADSAQERVASVTTTDVPAVIAPSIDTIHALLARSGRADGEVLTICCLEVAAWARREGMVHTAVEFAQAGALASPTFAEAALHTGIAASAAGQDARARTWLARAVTLARRERDRSAYVAALVELGASHERRGAWHDAEHYFRWAYRSSRRSRDARGARMRAAHGLLRVFRGREPRKAAQFAHATLRAYGREAQGGPEVLLDLATFWAGLAEGERAAAVLRLLWQRRAALAPPDRLTTAALAARFLTALNGKLRDAAEQEAWRLFADDSLPQAVRFQAALDLAHAARARGDAAYFTRARREVLRLAPQEVFPRVSADLAALWRAWPTRQPGGAP